MSDARWTLGDVFVLRHTGFPFDWLESLGISSTLAQRMLELLNQEAELIALATRLGGEARGRTVLQEVARGQRPSRFAGASPEFLRQTIEWETARTALEQAYGVDRLRLGAQLRQYGRDERVQEAVFLSSPDMFDNVWARYVAEHDRPDNADARRTERQVYSYLQRFCAKNETTSFFGPMGYGTIEGEGRLDVTRVAGAQPRRTFLSFWAVQELAKRINREKALRSQLPLRVNPVFTFAKDTASSASLGLTVALGDVERSILKALAHCDTTERLALELNTDLISAERGLLPLLKNAVVVRGLHYETRAFEAFERLTRAVGALPSSATRDGWLQSLGRLEGLRAEFERSNFAARRTLLRQIEAAFTELTGIVARRGEGKMYTDRLVLYEEAASPFRFRLGTEFAAGLARELSGGLQLSAAFGERVQRQYAEDVAQKLGRTELDFLSYAAALRPDTVGGSQFSPVKPISIPSQDGHEMEIESDACGDSQGGRFALPDVCLGAAPTDGDPPAQFQVVLARVHHHLFLWSWLCAFFEDRPRAERVARDWLDQEASAGGLVELALSRRNKAFYVFPGPRVAYTTEEVLELESGGLLASQLAVRIGDHGPELRDPTGRPLLLYLPLADFSTYPPFAALAHPLVLHAPLRTAAAHIPRVRIGGVAYQRERWEVDVSAWAKLSAFGLFLAVQRERRTQGWPRFLFGRVPSERKPFLLDTECPFSIELLKHLIRETAQITFEEMLPAPDELWLRDERGRYTFELRMQATRAGASND